MIPSMYILVLMCLTLNSGLLYAWGQYLVHRLEYLSRSEMLPGSSRLGSSVTIKTTTTGTLDKWFVGSLEKMCEFTLGPYRTCISSSRMTRGDSYSLLGTSLGTRVCQRQGAYKTI